MPKPWWIFCRTVYGDHFPIREMYDPKYIVQQQEAGLMYRVVVDAVEKVAGPPRHVLP